MVHTCVVAGCRNRRTPGTSLSFYRFPRDAERKQRWIAAVNRQGWLPNDGSRLCSTHFVSGKQVKNPRSPDYVPSIFTAEMKEPGPPEAAADKQEARVEAANALLFLQRQGGSGPNESSPKEREGSASSSMSADDEDEDDESTSDGKDEAFARTSNLDDLLKALRRENRALRESVEKMSLSESSLRNDAEK
ncbi:uncharacterized protein [Nerophis lumbriciformis]|uniref:uncharacterized protein n=1 Tax=Nerophis lumbriciformis TaxID=546530 RepID=UPI003BAC79FC